MPFSGRKSKWGRASILVHMECVVLFSAASSPSAAAFQAERGILREAARALHATFLAPLDKTWGFGTTQQ
jgi:hypothetical protein